MDDRFLEVLELAEVLQEALCMVGLALLVALWKGHDSPILHFSRIVGSIASVTEASSDAVSLVPNQSRSWSAQRPLPLRRLQFLLYTASMVWHGVDLHDLEGKHVAGHLFVDDPDMLNEWLCSPEGRAITGVNDTDIAEKWFQLARSVGSGLPVVQQSEVHLNLSGSFCQVRAAAHLAWTGHISFRFTVIMANFTTSWSNPVWAAFDCDLDAERSQIFSLGGRICLEYPGHQLKLGK